MVLPEADGQVVGERRPADATLRAEQRHHQRAGARGLHRALLPHLADHGGEVEAGERHLQYGVDAPLRVLGHGVLGDGEHDDADVRLRLADLLRDLLAAHAPLEERVHQHDVGPHLRHAGHGAVAGGDDVEHLDLRLRLQQRSNVRRDLWNVLHDQEPDLFACHPLTPCRKPMSTSGAAAR